MRRQYTLGHQPLCRQLLAEKSNERQLLHKISDFLSTHRLALIFLPPLTAFQPSSLESSPSPTHSCFCPTNNNPNTLLQASFGVLRPMLKLCLKYLFHGWLSMAIRRLWQVTRSTYSSHKPSLLGLRSISVTCVTFIKRRIWVG